MFFEIFIHLNCLKMEKHYEDLTLQQRRGLESNILAKDLFLDRMDDLGAQPVHSFTVYVDDDGFHLFCSETWVFSSWSSSGLTGEEVIGLFASSFINTARDYDASLINPKTSPI